MTLDKHTNHMRKAEEPVTASYKPSGCGVSMGRQWAAQPLKVGCKVQNAVGD